MLKKYLYKCHRILGTGLSILFMLWFLTGFIMIYHNFPRISDRQRYKGLSPIYLEREDIVDTLFKDLNSLNLLSLKNNSNGNLLIEYQINDKNNITDGKNISERQSFDNILRYATKVNSSPIRQIDTLNELDRWMPYDKQKADYPVYKFYFSDEKKSELYVSSLTGEGLQYTDSDSRFWAWIGAIPHWLYIANLRHNTELWKSIVIILSGIGSLMCISGIFIGFRAYIVRYRKKKDFNVRYKTIYKWHHISGFFFGIFIFTFVFSGMMSLQKIPQWIVKTYNRELEKSFEENDLINPTNYSLHYSSLIKKYAGRIKKIEWATFGNKPYYKAVIDDSLYFFDASKSDQIKPLLLDKSDILDKINRDREKDSIQIELMEDYDNYYIHKRYNYLLPVYKVMVDNLDKSLYYVNPKTGDIRYFNKSSKIRKWTYQALHSFSIKFLLDRPILWNIIMWTTMIGGTLVSFTGIWLAIKYIKRKSRKINKQNICQKEK